MLAALATLLSTPHPFKNCAAADHVHVSRIELSPDPPKPGLNVDVTFNATPDVAVSDGTLHVTVTLFGVPVPDTPTFQLCSEIGVKCPVAPGQNISGHAAYGVSKIVPSGIHVTITLTAKTAAGATIGCVSFDTPIGHAGVLEEIGGAAVPWSAGRSWAEVQRAEEKLREASRHNRRCRRRVPCQSLPSRDSRPRARPRPRPAPSSAGPGACPPGATTTGRRPRRWPGR